MNRNQFLQELAKLAGASVILPFCLPSCMRLTFVPFLVEGRRMVVKKSHFEENQFVLLKPAELPAPVYLCQLENGKYSAVLMRCTHRGCEVRPAGKELHCPCHGSAFTASGKVLEGPAQHPLRRFEVSSDEENIYIQ